MPSVIVDTDVFSFIFKGDTRAGLYADELRGKNRRHFEGISGLAIFSKA
jgi:hypothetical protein